MYDKIYTGQESEGNGTNQKRREWSTTVIRVDYKNANDTAHET